MNLHDGQTGNTVKIDGDNRLHVDSISKSVEHEANHSNGISYSVSFAATPSAEGDCFFYMKNTAETDMIIEGIGFYMAADQYFDIKMGDLGTPSGGASITPVNLNGGSGKSAIGLFQQGVDITGLSGGGVAYRIYHASSTGTVYTNFEQDIILPKNSTFSLYIQTGGVPLAGFIDMFYHREV
jgi:hypothetical protein